MAFAPVEELVREIARGRMVILVDDPSRENEGDLVMAAEKASADSIRFMATVGRGLICAPLSPAIADRLELPLMTENPSDPSECAFTISVDARVGTTTGISAFDRAATARLLADPAALPRDFKRPGHLFPLRADGGGVLARAGHTEAAIDLARLAGLADVGLICEVMGEDGEMARLPELERLAAREGLLIGTIEDIVAYRAGEGNAASRRPPRISVRELSRARLPTPLGVFEAHVFAGGRGEEVIALVQGDLRGGEPPLVRVHSACLTGDTLGSLRCDCGGQLEMALRRIGEEERGILIYLPQEGRGIGLARKIEAYRLQEAEGLDTVEANHRLGFPADLRTYEDAAAVLRHFGVAAARLMTNNPSKIEGLERHGIRIAERVSIEPGAGPVNLSYLRAKKGKLGHLFEAI
jgi:3,4-dihydroxy 2-butanone 4-phosphate synthase/GTP cyclohydrolase II